MSPPQRGLRGSARAPRAPPQPHPGDTGGLWGPPTRGRPAPQLFTGVPKAAPRPSTEPHGTTVAVHGTTCHPMSPHCPLPGGPGGVLVPPPMWGTLSPFPPEGACRWKSKFRCPRHVCTPTPPLGTHSHVCDTPRTPPHPPSTHFGCPRSAPAPPTRAPLCAPVCPHTRSPCTNPTPVFGIFGCSGWGGHRGAAGGDTRTKAVTKLRSEAGP